MGMKGVMYHTCREENNVFKQNTDAHIGNNVQNGYSRDHGQGHRSSILMPFQIDSFANCQMWRMLLFKFKR